MRTHTNSSLSALILFANFGSCQVPRLSSQDHVHCMRMNMHHYSFAACASLTRHSPPPAWMRPPELCGKKQKKL